MLLSKGPPDERATSEKETEFTDVKGKYGKMQQ